MEKYGSNHDPVGQHKNLSEIFLPALKAITTNPCVFPFKYGDKTYHACTNVDYEEFWCATFVNEKQELSDSQWGNCTALCPKKDKSMEEGIEKQLWFIITFTITGSMTILILLLLLGLYLAGKLRCRCFKNETSNHVILTFRESCFKTRFDSKDVKQLKTLDMD